MRIHCFFFNESNSDINLILQSGELYFSVPRRLMMTVETAHHSPLGNKTHCIVVRLVTKMYLDVFFVNIFLLFVNFC